MADFDVNVTLSDDDTIRAHTAGGYVSVRLGRDLTLTWLTKAQAIAALRQAIQLLEADN